MPELRLSLLGPPRVELKEKTVDIKRRKALALLIYLAVNGQPHSRDALATLFYPDHSQSRARAYLRRDLAVLNTSLEGDWLDADRDNIELKRDETLWLDVEEFRRSLAACRRHDHTPETPCAECLPLLTQAVALYTDDFLAGFTLRDCPEFDDWQFFQAESLRQELAATLERLVHGCSEQGHPEAAIPHARRWVGLDPLHEPAQRALIQLYDQAGQQAAALRQYEEYVDLLEEELGIPPEEETATLYEAIKAKRILAPHLKVEQQKAKRAKKEETKIAREEAAPQTPVVEPDKGPAVTEKQADLDVKETASGDLVGRETELQQLHSFLTAALNGMRQIVLVTGESGSGKTTLIEAFLEQAKRKTAFWIGCGQCLEHRGAGEPYMPVLEAFGRLCREPDGENLIALLTRLAPSWLVQMPWLVSSGDLEALRHRVEGATRDRMLREMVEAIETLTAERPLILVLEDLHWSDVSTLDLLSRLARRQERARLLLIGTYRLSDVRLQDHPLRTVVQEMRIRNQCHELALPPLPEPAVESYLASHFPSIRPSADLAHLLHERTGGNPLFVRTVIDSWIAQGSLARDNGRWSLQAGLDELVVGVPDNLRRLIEQQLRQLDPDDQKILEVASIAGMEFSAAVVAVGVELAEEEVESRCDALARRNQFLRSSGMAEWPDGTVAARFGFSHHLYQEVLYDRAPAGRRARLHRQIGERLEIAYGSQAPEIAVELALHFVRGRDAGRAAQYLHLAARQAMERNAHREAVAHLHEGLELLRRYPDLPDQAQYELPLQMMLAPALILTQGWSAPGAEQAYRRAAELCRELGDVRQLSSVLYGMAALYELRGDYLKSHALLEERLEVLRDLQDNYALLESHELMACSTLHQGAFAKALEHAEQAISLYNPQRHLPLTAILGENPAVSSYHWGGLALWFLGYPDQAVARSQQALDQTKDFAYTFSLTHAHQQATMLRQLRRDKQEVAEGAETTINVAIQSGFSYWVGVGKILRGWATAFQGQAEQGVADLREGLDLCLATGATLDHPYFLALLAEACGQAGRTTQGLEALAEALAMARNSRVFFYEAELHRLRGELLLRAGAADHAAEAEANFQRALAVAREQEAKSLELRAAVSLGWLWREQGKEVEARELLEQIYDWFTEGFDTADLQEASSLLKALGSDLADVVKRQEIDRTNGVPAAGGALTSIWPERPQQIYFCTTPDDVRLAYAISGEGPPLVKAANWLSHLEFDWQSPVWRHWHEALSQHHTLIRYDERGCGLSDWAVDDVSFDTWVEDLESVVNAAGLDRFPLLGISQGGSIAVAYAARYPERVSHLILYGTIVRGVYHRELTAQERQQREALLNLVEPGWGQENPAFRQVFTTLFMPGGTLEQYRWFNELQKRSTSPENAAKLLKEFYTIDVRRFAPQVKAPTLVLHATGDAEIPFGEGQLIASLIPGARFVPLESSNHVLLEHEPAWRQFQKELLAFLKTETTTPHQQVKPAAAATGRAADLGEPQERFVQEELLATGGMGKVYRGLDRTTGQPVAIKRLRPELAEQNPEAIQRLVREGDLLRQLNHPNVVKVLATFETNGQPVIVMEYVPNRSLRELLKEQGQLPLGRVLDIGLELADALARVHHVGIIHRDLKPGNILLAEDGTPRLTDFGVAHLAQQELRLTQEGAILGTTIYVSPEAWRGEELDTRSDIWSFGAVLYEMLAGQPPFVANQVAAILNAILNDPLPDVRSFREDAPPALGELIKQMLVKERERRIDSMRQVAAGLEIVRRSALA